MDGPGDWHMEWGKSERGKLVSHNITYMWNLEKWCRWIYLQSRHTDAENKHMDTKGDKGWDKLEDWDSYV